MGSANGHAYSPTLNRDRVGYVLHCDQAPEIVDALRAYGFDAAMPQSVDEVFRWMEIRPPDFVLMDISEVVAEHGLMARLLGKTLGVRIFLLSDPAPDPALVLRLGQEGAREIFVRPIEMAELIVAVESELRRDIRVDAGGAMLMGVNSLTPRERAVMQMIVDGFANKEIGIRLGISPKTVEVHRTHIMEKVHARNAADLVRIVLGHAQGRARDP